MRDFGVRVTRSIGLTGGIASGKSTVSRLLAERGAVIIDADQLGHRTYEPGTDTFRQVMAAFGEDLVAEDGAIDRRALGARVFGQPAELKRLTDIVWPGIRRLAAAELAAQAAAGAEVVVLEAAVMIEAGWQDLVDEVWVITAPPAVARARLMERNGFQAEEADRRIQSQIDNEERIAQVDVVLSTDCSLAEVAERVEEAWAALGGRIAAASAAGR